MMVTTNSTITDWLEGLEDEEGLLDDEFPEDDEDGELLDDEFNDDELEEEVDINSSPIAKSRLTICPSSTDNSTFLVGPYSQASESKSHATWPIHVVPRDEFSPFQNT